MANETKQAFLEELTQRYGSLRKLERTQSLYEVGQGAARIYIRYSRVHGGNATFYGLREEDILRLEGHPSIICFLWDGQTEPLLVPFAQYEDVLRSLSPAGDGQYKAQVYLQEDATELYIARAGRFNVETYLGWGELDSLMDSSRSLLVPELSHSQVQTILGAIGVAKSYDVWIPQSDRSKLDWAIARKFECCPLLPYGVEPINDVLQEVDVIWIRRGSSELRALFEVEHSTPVYSGLLRFNDILLAAPAFRPRFSIVANSARRSVFVRQLNRLTFRRSGLSELCTFLDYADVFGWHRRIAAE